MFQILKQSHPNLGCIPACARSVLAEAGVPAPTEQELIDEMYPSGFVLLAKAFRALGLNHRVEIEKPASADLTKRVVELNADGHPVLFPVRKGGVVHCLSAVGCSPAEAVLHDPGDGSVRKGPWAAVMALWTGDIAYIVTARPQGSASSPTP